jgi:hypothetical protein
MEASTVNTVSGVGDCEAAAQVGLGIEKAITGPPTMGSPVEDTVELSPAGLALSRADDQSRAQIARLVEIRAQIKGGTFLTPERIDETAERLLKILGGSGRTEAQTTTREMEIAVSPGNASLNARLRRYQAAGMRTITLRIAQPPKDAGLPA